MTKYLTILFTLLFCVSAFCAVECLRAETSRDADFTGGAKDCVVCHDAYAGLMESPMVSRSKEKAFIDRMFGKIDPDFMQKNCSGCHVNSCMDCHSETPPAVNTCLKCHNGANAGADYAGLGIREDHERYYRGPKLDTGGVNDEEHYMKMLPDVHFEASMTCGRCHTMASLAGIEPAKKCGSCHTYSQEVIDHQVKGHDNVTCVGCHTAWSPIEYGTFYIRLRESGTMKSYYRWVKQFSEEYAKSSFMRLNSTPALAKNSAGIYAPVRPRIVYFTDVYREQLVGRDNIMLSDRWEIFTPHTVRRETLTCEPCHNNRRKYLLETDDERYLMPEKDGLNIKSFYNSRYFSIQNGRFISEGEFKRLSTKNKEYIKFYFKQLDSLEKVIGNASTSKK